MVPAFSAPPALATRLEDQIAAIMHGVTKKAGHKPGLPTLRHEGQGRPVGRPRAPRVTLDQLVDYIRANPGKTRYEMANHFKIGLTKLSDLMAEARVCYPIKINMGATRDGKRAARYRLAEI